MLGYIFCHGWGLDPEFFSPLSACFQGRPLLFWDMGYFGESRMPIPDPDGQWIGVGHSLGLVKLLQSPISFKAIIGLQSAPNFLGNDPALRRHRTREYTRFCQSFIKDSVDFLVHFRKSIGGHKPSNGIVFDRLQADLISLEADHTPLLRSSLPTLIIGNEDDTVVPPGVILDNFVAHPQIQLQFYPTGGHGLCAPHAADVAKKIHQFVEAL